MKHTDIKYLILQLEKDFPVNKWKVNNVHIWPLLKGRLISYIILKFYNDHNEINLFTEKREVFSTSKKYSLPKLFVKRLMQYSVKLFSMLNYHIWMLFLPKAKYIFVGTDDHRVNYKGKRYNRFFDTLIDKYNLKKHSLYLECDLNPKSLKYNSSKVFQFIDKIHFFKTDSTVDFCLENYENFIHELDKVDMYKEFVIKNSLSTIKQWGQTTFINRYMFFEKILKKISPVQISFLCYYSEERLILNAVANNLGIRTVEMQHGPMALDHFAYGYWLNIPNGGYDMLPRTYWCWDEISSNVLKHLTKDNVLYQIKITGNPWINYWKSKNTSYRYSDYILFSLHPIKLIKIEDVIPMAIINIIKKKKDIWFLRLHPRGISQKDEIVSYLKSNGIYDMVNIEQATFDPLPLLLANAKLHVTRNSGVTLEAASFNLKTVIIDEIGKEYYKEVISKEEALYLNPRKSDFETLFQNYMDKVNNTIEIDEVTSKYDSDLFD